MEFFVDRMTSTGFNVGLRDDRNSSRVLRPPGGGHTDIFGAEPLPVKRDTGRNASSILEGTNSDPAPAAVKPTTPIEETKTNSESGSAQASNQRTRVPPGGFSSGLW